MHAITARAWRPWLMLALKCAVVLAVAWGVRRTVLTALDQLTHRPVHIHWSALAASGGLYLLGLLPSAYFYHALLREQGAMCSLGRSVRAYYLGQLGKYVPGKAAVVVIRTSLMAGPTVSPTLAAVAVVYETLTFMAVGTALAGGLCLLLPMAWSARIAAAAAATVAVLPVLPPVFRRIAQMAHRVGASDQALARWHVRPATLAKFWLADALGWGLMGCSLWCVAVGLGHPAGHWTSSLPLCVTAVAGGVAAGFFALIPGGAVVREGVMMQVLSPATGEAVALAAPIVLRLVWLVFELAVSAILVFWPPASEVVR